ncbi:MAG: hypothetical protein DBY38_00270 [Clostridium cadaveris]|uniref:Uncharacterized protein n=1 Tax=Clostridium cadaveris TaxID=1529 RepID=A0A316MB98_9CLOT|nr:MAG: hypothetical protein DBY38_00270 [Clostridium cadaveris]
MHKESVINKEAWEYKSYEFFVKSDGLPSECAKDTMISPPMIRNGFIIKEFNEDPSWTDEKLPGEFTIYAMK